MVVIGGTIRIDPGKRTDAIAVAQKMMVETHKEAGCVVYNMSFDLEDGGLVGIFEEWESEEAVAKHFETPHIAEFMLALPELGVTETAVHRYTVTDKSAIGADS